MTPDIPHQQVHVLAVKHFLHCTHYIGFFYATNNKTNIHLLSHLSTAGLKSTKIETP